jgi:hypothetical protein
VLLVGIALVLIYGANSRPEKYTYDFLVMQFMGHRE